MLHELVGNLTVKWCDKFYDKQFFYFPIPMETAIRTE